MTYALIKKTECNASPCLVLGYFGAQAEKKFEAEFNTLDTLGEYLWLQDKKQNVLLIHCGDEKKADLNTLKTLITTLTQALTQQKVKHAAVCLPRINAITPNQQLEYMVLNAENSRYEPALLKTKSKTAEKTHPELGFYLQGATTDAIDNAIATAAGMTWTRNLANLPGNYCTPSHLADEAVKFAKAHKNVKSKILERKDMEALGMGAFLSIAKGSHEPPKLVQLEYRGAAKDAAPVVLVGKGVTFDAGGISLKPPRGMHEMKYDMAGAASVLGVIKACVLMKLPLNVTGLLACTENMPSGGATKPGDVVTSMLGKTIEITNTDAEGRMVLADTLTYAERFKPQLVLDIATLTGAIIIALGRWANGFMTEDEALAELIETAGIESNDPAWRMPLDTSYQKALESPVADMINAVTDGEAGSVTAAQFLANFTENFRWAHFDIAGTAWNSGKHHGATGRPVPILVHLLRHLAHAH